MRYIIAFLFALCGFQVEAATVFIKDPATADTIGAAGTCLNTLPLTITRATAAWDPRTETIVGAGILRTRTQVIGTTNYTQHLIEASRTNILAAGTSGRFDQWTAANGLTVAADTTAAPDGGVTAQTLTDPGASLSSARQTFTVADDSIAHIFTVYVLKTSGGTAPTFGVTLALTGGTPVTTNARINTDTGAQQYGSNANTTVVNADSTYWRVVVMVTNNTTANTTLTLDVYPAAAAYGASSDSAAATGSAICTFSDLVKNVGTGSGSGLINYQSFISNRNMLIQSETLNTTWTKSRCSITSDSTANPLDSSVTADTIVEDGTATSTHGIEQAITKPSSSSFQYTYSTYLKQSGRTWALVRIMGPSNTNGKGVYFNLATGATGSTETTGAGYTLDASSITAVGSWYRCLVTVTTDAAATVRPEVYAATADNGKTYSGTSSASIICYGNQLVYGAVAQNYWAVGNTVGVRAADTVSIDLTGLSGGGLSTTDGTLIAVMRPYGWSVWPSATNAAMTRHSAAPTVSLSLGNVSGQSTATRSDGGGAHGPNVNKTWTDGVSSSFGITWNATAAIGYADGGLATGSAAPTSLPWVACTTLPLGVNDSATSQCAYSYLSLHYWTPSIPPAQVQIFHNGIVP